MASGQPRSWSQRDDQSLIDAYGAGETLAQIAADHGCEIHHVFDRLAALRRAGHDLPPRKPNWTEERRQLLAKRRRQGASLRELEAEFEITRGTLTSQLRTLKAKGYGLGPSGYGT